MFKKISLNQFDINLFSQLYKHKIELFGSSISASQYLPAYRLISPYLKPKCRVLDWGTGTGHFSYFLLKKNCDVTGFSLHDNLQSTAYPQLAKTLQEEFSDQYNIVVDSKSFKSLPFAKESFDLVASIGVLEHVRETGGTELDSLREIQRILTEQGIFFCYHFPNKFSWIEAVSKRISGKYSHPYKYSEKEIRELISQTDFELLTIRKYGFLPRLMFNRLLCSVWFANLFNTIDCLLSRLFPWICQNHLFILKKCSQKSG